MVHALPATWFYVAPRPQHPLGLCSHPCEPSKQASEVLFNLHFRGRKLRHRADQRGYTASSISATHAPGPGCSLQVPGPHQGWSPTNPFGPSGGYCSWQGSWKGGWAWKWRLKGRWSPD